MRKLTFLFFLFFSAWSIGQQSITSKLTASFESGGTGVGYFSINYSEGNYNTRESDVISVNATDTNNIIYSLHYSILDSNKTKLDSTITLTSNQVSLLNNFYQSASSGSNPDPAISNTKTGASGTLTVSLCCGDATDMTYTTGLHISLCRYILSNWANWN